VHRVDALLAEIERLASGGEIPQEPAIAAIAASYKEAEAALGIEFG
jgi:hypothetical protein